LILINPEFGKTWLCSTRNAGNSPHQGSNDFFFVGAKILPKVIINLKWYQMTLKLPIVHLYADRLNEILCCVFLHSTQILTLNIIVLIVTHSATFSFVSHFLGSNFIYSILQDNCLHKRIWKNATTAKANLVSDWKNLIPASKHLKLEFQLLHDILFLEYYQHVQFFSALIKPGHPTGIVLKFWHQHLQASQKNCWQSSTSY